MEKMFKNLTVYLSLLLALSVVFSVFCLPKAKNVTNKIDPFGANGIAENIKNMEMNMTSVVYAMNDEGDWEEYYRIHGAENRLWVSIDKMPKHLINAFIAIEDETFYKHSGINWKRTLGAVSNMLFKFDETEFGGSTITQQLIKNVTSDNDRSAIRKIREIIRAIVIEKKLDKTQILEAYLNTIALGNGICGVQVAANYYFNKDVSELDLSEAATIAAITKNPSRYNPITGLEANKERRKLVLKKMLEWDYITPSEMLSVYDVKIDIDDTQKEAFEGEVNDYFIDTLIEQVIDDLMEEYDCSEEIASSMLYNGGYKIYSTVNPKIQESMEKVYENVDRYFYLKGKNSQGERVHAQSGMTIMDYSGHIVGIVGGAGEKTVNRGLNRAYGVPQQPGSTMKPIGVYALAIEKDLIHYSSKVEDEPLPHYTPEGKPGPKEWYGYYKGTITVDYAIRKSANTIPVKLLEELGVKTSFNFLTKKLGMKYLTDVDKNLSSLALGGCHYGITPTESAAAYAIFGNQGKYYKPTTYSKIERINGDVVLKYKDKGKQVISSATATIMNHLLQGVVYGSEGTGGSIAGFSGMKAFAKTGTSSESCDLWMVAGSPYYVGSVWYGFDKRQTVYSTSAAATIWRDVMRDVHRGLEFKSFEDSEDVVKKGSGYYKKGSKPDNLTLMSGAESSSSTLSSTTSSSSKVSSTTNSSYKASSSKNSSSKGSSSKNSASKGSSSKNSSSKVSSSASSSSKVSSSTNSSSKVSSSTNSSSKVSSSTNSSSNVPATTSSAVSTVTSATNSTDTATSSAVNSENSSFDVSSAMASIAESEAESSVQSESIQEIVSSDIASDTEPQQD